jgi:hypothetical protein
MVARATAPNSVGPGSVFPDAAKWDFEQGLKGFFIFLFLDYSDAFLTEHRREPDGSAIVLDCSHLSAYHCFGLLLVLS